MASTSETVLAALAARLGTGLPSGAVFLRNALLPERVPSAGIAILRDGAPASPRR